jgi:hypothetical protein
MDINYLTNKLLKEAVEKNIKNNLITYTELGKTKNQILH